MGLGPSSPFAPTTAPASAPSSAAAPVGPFATAGWLTVSYYTDGDCSSLFLSDSVSYGQCEPQSVEAFSSPLNSVNPFLPGFSVSTISLDSTSGDLAMTRWNYTDPSCATLSHSLPNPVTSSLSGSQGLGKCIPLSLHNLPVSFSALLGRRRLSAGSGSSGGSGGGSSGPPILSLMYTLSQSSAVPTTSFIGILTGLTKDPACKDPSKLLAFALGRPEDICAEVGGATSGIDGSYSVHCQGAGNPVIVHFPQANCQGGATVVPPSAAPTMLQKEIDIINSVDFQCSYHPAEHVYVSYNMCAAASEGTQGAQGSGAAADALSTTQSTAIGVGVGVSVGLACILAAAFAYYRFFLSKAPLAQQQHASSSSSSGESDERPPHDKIPSEKREAAPPPLQRPSALVSNTSTYQSHAPGRMTIIPEQSSSPSPSSHPRLSSLSEKGNEDF